MGTRHRWRFAALVAVLAVLPAAPVAPATAAECDPNYDMACVPIADDVDCAGGNGNGPAYVQGPVRVIGKDIYELDRDGDGWACEPKGWRPPR
jgi:hypothetical protein